MTVERGSENEMDKCSGVVEEIKIRSKRCLYVRSETYSLPHGRS